MAAQIETRRLRSRRWRLRKKDGGPGRKMRARDAKETAIQERRALGKLKNRPGKQNGRPDRKKAVRTRKTAAGNRQNRFLRFDGPRDGPLSLFRGLCGATHPPATISWRVPA